MPVVYIRELEQLKRGLLEVGSLVERATNRAIDALVERRADLARAVIAADDAVDSREVQVEEECLRVMAKHHPVAGDLRFLVTVLKVNNDLERMADLAVDIAQRALALAEAPPLPVALDFRAMAERVRTMVWEALDCLLRFDVGLAETVRREDDAVDAVTRGMFSTLEALMERDPSTVNRAVHLLSASRHLERIADLATNIAEDVIFLVRGDVVRHRSPIAR